MKRNLALFQSTFQAVEFRSEPAVGLLQVLRDLQLVLRLDDDYVLKSIILLNITYIITVIHSSSLEVTVLLNF